MIRVFRKIIAYYFHSFFKKYIRRLDKKVFICDIDNSIANTWPQWKNKPIYNKSFYQKVPPLTNSINFVKGYCLKNNFQIIFISARPYDQILHTRNWLSHYFVGNSPLIFVKNAKDKLWYYQTLMELKKDFEVFDDLSYNHENGEVKYFTELIDFLNSNSIKHFDYSYIKNLNEETA